MASLYGDLKEGLEQAIAYSEGKGTARVIKYAIEPVRKLDKDEIKAVRNNAHMSQATFAAFLGVSKKTVEAWENGRIHPTGPTYRLMGLLADGKVELPFVRQEQF